MSIVIRIAHFNTLMDNKMAQFASQISVILLFAIIIKAINKETIIKGEKIINK